MAGCSVYCSSTMMVALLQALLLASFAPLVAAFSEGMKGCTRIAESVYFAAHHDGNAILRLDNTTTQIVIGSALGEPGDSDGFGRNARLHGPQGIVYDGNRTVYFTDTFNGKLKSFDTESLLVASLASLGPAQPFSSNKQQDAFPIAVDFVHDGDARFAFVSKKFNASIFAIDVGAIEGRGGAATSAWLRAYQKLPTSVNEILTRCVWDKPHGISVSREGRLLLADDTNGIHIIDLRQGTPVAPRACTVLSGTSEKYLNFRGVRWTSNATALLMERSGPGTIYHWNIDTNESAAIVGGGGSESNSGNTCWRDGRGIENGTTYPKRGLFWKAMHLDWSPRWPDSIIVADTGANFLRRVTVDPTNLFLANAVVTTIPCFNTTYRFTKSQPGTIEHGLCGVADGPAPEQLPPCDTCMQSSLGTWCDCTSYTQQSWCVNPPPTPAPTPTPGPSPSPPTPSPPAVPQAVCYGKGEGEKKRYVRNDSSNLVQCRAACLAVHCTCFDYADAARSTTGKDHCRVNVETSKTKLLTNSTSVWTAFPQAR